MEVVIKGLVCVIIPRTMNFLNNYRVCLMLGGGGLVLGLVEGRYKSLKQIAASKELHDVEIRAMTNLNKTCRACIYIKRICYRGERDCSYAILRWIVDLLDSARETIDAAIYLVTCSEFKDAFVNAHKRGVKIRFISDSTMASGTGSAIHHLRTAGVEVRVAGPEERHMMHRKSVVVDNRWLLSGTGNWTMQSLCGNWDSFSKTRHPKAVSAFLEAFEVEWGVLDPAPVPAPVALP